MNIITFTLLPSDLECPNKDWKLPDLTKISGRGTEFWRIQFLSEKHSLEITHGLFTGKHTIDLVLIEINNSGRSYSEQAFLEAKQRYKEKIFSGYNIPGTKPLTRIKEPMLCKKFQDECNNVKYPVAVQPKIDGVRCRAFYDQETALLVFSSRNNHENYDMEHLVQPVKYLFSMIGLEQVEFDGELYSTEIKHNELSGLLRLKRQKTEVEIKKLQSVKYVIFDIIGTKLPYWKRSSILIETLKYLEMNSMASIFLDSSPVIVALGYCLANSRECCDMYLNWFISDGFEGLMVRDLESPYKSGRSHRYLLKYKLFDDDEYEIIGALCGTGTHKDAIIFECKTISNKTFTVVPNWTLAERKDAYSKSKNYIGKFLTVKHQGCLLDDIPRFGKGLYVREEE